MSDIADDDREISFSLFGIQNYVAEEDADHIAEADADSIPVSGESE